MTDNNAAATQVLTEYVEQAEFDHKQAAEAAIRNLRAVAAQAEDAIRNIEAGMHTANVSVSTVEQANLQVAEYLSTARRQTVLTAAFANLG